MLVGHFGAALAAKRVAPQTSAGTLMLASLAPDFLAWTLLIAGIERARIHPGITRTKALEMYDIAISHSLLMDAVWGALLAVLYLLWRRHGRGSWVILALVLSHWVLDFLSHRPDMPLAPGIHTYLGLGLYNSLPGILAVEGFIWLAGVAVYASSTRASRRAGTYAFWGVVVLLTALWVLSQGAPPPPNLVRAGISSLIFFSLVVLWAYLINRVRPASQSAPAPARGIGAGQEV